MPPFLTDLATTNASAAALAPLFGVAGAAVGSFVGAALERLPGGRSIVVGRSRCDTCGKALGVAELVPVLSWLAQRGRCRTCRARIGVAQLGCELAGAAIGLGAWWWAPGWSALAAMALGWQLLLLGVLDLRHLWLPRVLVMVLALTGLLVSGIKGFIDEVAVFELGRALAGGALGFALLVVVAWGYRRLRGHEGMGRGDPPLLGAIGLWLGPTGVVEVLLGASISGLVAVLAMKVAGAEATSRTALPLGTFLAIAAWPVFLLQIGS